VPIRGLILLLLVICTSCDSGSSRKVAVAPATVWGTGTIQGRVSFVGMPPVMRTLPNQPCCEGATPIPEETVLLDSKGGMGNTFVYIEGLPASDGALPPTTLDQKNCRFVPHAIGVAVGQTLNLRSEDPTMHTVTYSPEKNLPENFSMTSAGAESTTTFSAPEFVHARCDIHPWMNAWIGVFDNPFFTVSRGDGTFEISRVPAGKYKIASWQERYGEQEQEITVEEGKPVEINFEYRAP